MAQKKKRFSRYFIPFGVLIVVIAIGIAVSTKLSFFDGVNVISFNCGSIEVGENGSETTLNVLSNNRSLQATGNCFANNFKRCIPTHADLNSPGIDVNEHHALSIYAQGRLCQIKDAITATGMIIGSNGTKSTYLLCGNAAMDAQNGLVLYCNNGQNVTVSFRQN